MGNDVLIHDCDGILADSEITNLVVGQFALGECESDLFAN